MKKSKFKINLGIILWLLVDFSYAQIPSRDVLTRAAKPTPSGKTTLPTAESIIACKDLKYFCGGDKPCTNDDFKSEDPKNDVTGPKNQICKTSKNKCLQVIEDKGFKIGLQELGNCNHQERGAIWAIKLKQLNVNYDTANDPKTCPAGTHPPKKEDFVRLRDSVSTEPNLDAKNYFDPTLNQQMLSAGGKEEFYSLLPDMKNHGFWSSSYIDPPIRAVYFDGNVGIVDGDSCIDNVEAVRCLRLARGKKLI